ncbi:MAG: preprotein translocase subunit SecA, partial [Bdellovibrio sp.]
GKHFEMEEKTRTASLTDEGNAQVEKLLGIENLYDPQHIELLHHIYQGLKAHYLYKLDVEYMIKDGEVVIVDEFTGRLMPGRRWSDGLHQAIEAKEKVEVKNENQTLATITFQNYFRMYNKLAGMTGTAETEAVEFKKIYNLDVTVIPTNKPILRKDLDDVVYKNENAKFRAIVQDLRERHENGQPILVGTVSIEKSEKLSHFLKNEGIRHSVLNAKAHEREAEIVAQAGRFRALTIATNMAGRGTDIVLGGNPEAMAKAETKMDSGPEFEASLARYRPQCEGERKKVVEAGGLYIVGTERHESRRIDNQLRGRSGRQGDPGASKFYLSLEDNLMRIFNGEMIQRIMDRLNVPEDEPITARMVSRSIEGAQRKVEGHNFDIRKHLLDYDNVMNHQRNIIYKMRRQILEGKQVERTFLDMLGDVSSHLLDIHAPESQKKEHWNVQGLLTSVQQQFGIRLPIEQMQDFFSEDLSSQLKDAVSKAFSHQKTNLGSYYEQVLKMILLQAIDQRWKEHLQVVDRLKEGINLRGYAQKDPLIEYKKEAFAAFESLNLAVRTDAIEKFLKVQIVDPAQAEAMQNLMNEPDFSGMDYSVHEEASLGVTSSQLDAPVSSERGSAKQRVRMTAGSSADEDRNMNRAQRRRLEKQRTRR